jgi:hypothetical protein
MSPAPDELKGIPMRWLKEPLTHFLLLGGLIFAVNALINGASPGTREEIVVSLSQQENLANTFARTWQRAPSQSELNSLIVDFIRQEIAYREGQELQLDRDDIVIRRRMRQKLEILAEDVASLTPPAEAELREYFAENAEDFMRPALLSFRQVFFNDGNDSDSAAAASLNLLAKLQVDPDSVDFQAVGDQSLLPTELDGVRATELDSLFGGGFADAVQRLQPGKWDGPVQSAFGLHLVRLDERTDSSIPEFQEVADLIAREMLVERRRNAIDKLYDRLLDKYRISIEATADVLPNTTPGSAP